VIKINPFFLMALCTAAFAYQPLSQDSYPGKSDRRIPVQSIQKSCGMETAPFAHSAPDEFSPISRDQNDRNIEIPINYHVIYVAGDSIYMNVTVDNQNYPHCMWDIRDYDNNTFLLYPGFGFDYPGHSYSLGGVLPPGNYGLFLYDEFGTGGISATVTTSSGTVLASVNQGSWGNYTFLNFTAPEGNFTNGLLSMEVMEQQTAVLNSVYNEFGYSFTTSSVDSAVNAGWYYATDSHKFETGQWENDDQYLNMSQAMTVDVTGSINYFWTGASLTSGLGVFPWSFPEDDSRHGLFCGNYTIPGGESGWTEGYTGVHEVGHYLGLYHTFENGCSAPGDHIEDTPDQAEANYGCPTSNYSCGSYDDMGNYMDYVDDACMTHFTQGQKDRIDWAIETYRPALLGTAVDPAVVSVVHEFEEQNILNMTDSIFFSGLNETANIAIAYDTVDYYSGDGALDVAFTLNSADAAWGNWAGVNFTNSDGSRIDFSAAETLSVMIKVEMPPNHPEYMSFRFLLGDRPVLYGFDEFWAVEDSLLVDAVNDWTEVKIPLKPFRNNIIHPVLGSSREDGFILSPWWWNLQYNNWQLDRERINICSILVGINGYGDNVSTVPADSVRISLDYMTLKDSSGYEHTANFNDQLDEICHSPISQRQGLVNNLMASLPAFPYIEPVEDLFTYYEGGIGENENFSMAHFLYTGTHGYVAVPGSFNNWNGTLWNLSNIPGTDFWFRPLVMPNHGRFNYAYYADGSWYGDPLNDVTCMDGNGNMSDQVNGPEYVSPPELVYNDSIFHGTLFDTVFYSGTLGNSRMVTVYLPPGYESSNASYPVVFYHDGDKFLVRDIENIFDNLIEEQRISPLIAVFIPPVNRTEEYTGLQQGVFANFVIDQIFPWLVSKYRILEGPENHATFGFSDGGNISLFLTLNRFDIFGRMGGFSPTLNSSYNTLATNLTQLTTPPDLDFYLESYWYDNLLFDVVGFRDTLESLEYDLLFTDYPDGHEWCRVIGNQDVALEYLFPYQELSVDEKNTALPAKFVLHQNYPNPFNPVTQIRYDLPEDSYVSITIYDIMGRTVRTMVNSLQNAGYKSVRWNATNDLGEPVSAGMYIFTIQAGEFRQTKKMVLLK